MKIMQRHQIQISDADGITDEQWSHILTRMHYIGYDFHDINDMKEYMVHDKAWLNDDQSDEVLYCLGMKKLRQISKPEINATFRRAIKRFGITYSWPLAGYIMPDGKMLDFSEGQYQRTLDHRQIHEIVSHNDNMSACDIMTKFMCMGCIRCLPNGFDTVTIPTEPQRKIIYDALSDNETVYIDISNSTGHTVTSLSGPGGRNNVIMMVSNVCRIIKSYE